MRRLDFWVDGKPVGYKRNTARYGALADVCQEWRKAIAVAYREAVLKREPSLPLSGEYRQNVRIECVFYVTTADGDNLAKEVLDALNGIAYDDDRRVCKLAVEVMRRFGPDGKPIKLQGAPLLPGASIGVVFEDLP